MATKKPTTRAARVAVVNKFSRKSLGIVFSTSIAKAIATDLSNVQDLLVDAENLDDHVERQEMLFDALRTLRTLEVMVLGEMAVQS